MSNDVFGIKMIYPTKPSSAQGWHMDNDPTRDDPRTSDFKGDIEGSGVNTILKVNDHEVRMNVFAESKKAYDRAVKNRDLEYDQEKLANRKYMMLPNDWKNVEITAYIKVTSATNDDNNGGAHFEWFCRGGPKHNEDRSCEGTSYHANIYEKKIDNHDDRGKAKFEKELQHTDGYAYQDKIKVTDSLKGRWIGYKAVFYSYRKDGKEVVKMEQWLDEGSDNESQPGNNWKDRPVHEYLDDGNWETDNGNGYCGGSSKQIITWGGPSASFRSDEIKYLFKWASVREIVPPQ
jgi:hypothetical protein